MMGFKRLSLKKLKNGMTVRPPRGYLRNLTDYMMKFERMVALEALIAKTFATVSAIKAGYAQLQHAQSPYDVEGIQAADQLVVSDLKKLLELKQCFLKKQFDPSPDNAMILAKI